LVFFGLIFSSVGITKAPVLPLLCISTVLHIVEWSNLFRSLTGVLAMSSESTEELTFALARISRPVRAMGTAKHMSAPGATADRLSTRLILLE